MLLCVEAMYLLQRQKKTMTWRYFLRSDIDNTLEIHYKFSYPPLLLSAIIGGFWFSCIFWFLDHFIYFISLYINSYCKVLEFWFLSLAISWFLLCLSRKKHQLLLKVLEHFKSFPWWCPQLISYIQLWGRRRGSHLQRVIGWLYYLHGGLLGGERTNMYLWNNFCLL